MPCCCPPGHGCNDPDSGEPCALDLLRAAAPRERQAAAALARWAILERAAGRRRNSAERRFRRRAFERVRDQALVAIAMRAGADRPVPANDAAAANRSAAVNGPPATDRTAMNGIPGASRRRHNGLAPSRVGK